MKTVVLTRLINTTHVTGGACTVYEANGDALLNFKTLELPYKGNQSNISAVPAGFYELNWEYSPAFDEYLWELKGVPFRSECKFHVANYTFELRGCIAPGKDFVHMNGDGVIDINDSRNTLKKFHEAMNAEKNDTAMLYIINAL